MKTTERNERFYLGEITGGRVYNYTGFGGFKTVDKAVSKWRSSPRNGAAVVFRQADVVCHGVVYGSTEPEAVTTVNAP